MTEGDESWVTAVFGGGYRGGVVGVGVTHQNQGFFLEVSADWPEPPGPPMALTDTFVSRVFTITIIDGVGPTYTVGRRERVPSLSY